MIRSAVVGASGYAGAELAALLTAHPGVRLEALQADSSAGALMEDLHPRLRHRLGGRLQPPNAAALAGLDAVFLALPHGVAATTARALLGKVGSVIDLSGDLRLADAATYKEWYGMEHPAPELLGQAAYGLPELFGDDLEGARLVACAGCYATAVQLAAAPVLAAAASGDGRPLSITASAMSGTSGAGRKGTLDLSFSEVHGDLRAYRVGRHQHAPEMAAGLSRHAGRQVSVTFIPHLVPVARGILATVVAPLPAATAGGDLLALYEKTYASAPLVRVVDPARRLPGTADVSGTPFCDLSPVVDAGGGTAVIIAAIDNLMKGAASQAVQVMNQVFALAPTAGLLTTAPFMEASHA